MRRLPTCNCRLPPWPVHYLHRARRRVSPLPFPLVSRSRRTPIPRALLAYREPVRRGWSRDMAASLCLLWRRRSPHLWRPSRPLLLKAWRMAAQSRRLRRAAALRRRHRPALRCRAVPQRLLLVRFRPKQDLRRGRHSLARLDCRRQRPEHLDRSPRRRQHPMHPCRPVRPGQSPSGPRSPIPLRRLRRRRRRPPR